MRESGRGVWSGARGLRDVRRAGARPVCAVCACAVVAAVLLLHAPLAAQRGGVVRGRVVEAGTATPVASAVVRVADASGRSVLTDADGAFRLDGLEPGAHRLRVAHLGYAEREVEVEVTRAGEVVIDVVLTPRALALDALVVTAGRRLQALADVPVPTEVVSAEESRRSGASDVAAVLVERTGIQPQGGHPAGAGLMLQGLGSERVLVLVDGQPFIGRLSGQIDLSRLPAAAVERIEVVKGPQSTLYGSEAMGGVVNVITRPAGERGERAWRAEVVMGSADRLDFGAGARGGLGRLGYVAELGRREIAVTPGMADTSGARADRWDGLATLRWSGERGHVEASALVLDERQRWRNGQLYDFADNRQWSLRLGASHRAGAHRFAPILYVTEFRHLARRSTMPEPAAGTGEEEVQREVEAELAYTLQAGAHVLDAGVEAKRRAIRSARVVGGSRTLHTVEPFIQATLAAGPFSVVPGARLSWSEEWGTHWTPRLAALWRATPSLAVRASFGTGYRAPDFKELYMQFLNISPGVAYAVRGNPELQPETSTNVTGSVEWTGARLYLRAQAFHNRFRDFIETRAVGDSAGVTLFTYGNIDDGRTRGIELEAGATWHGLRGEAGYAWLDAERTETGEPLLGRPAHSGRLSLTYALPFGLRASASGVYTGRTPIQRTESGEVLHRDGFLRIDLRVAQALPHGLEIAAGVDNVLDARPEQWPGFAERQFHVSIGWRSDGVR
ncbi:MAG TPA: TonB-dependent receptor [Longimicrobiales bacterium]